MELYIADLENEEVRERIAQIYMENYNNMFYAAMQMLNHREDAENVVHDSFVKLTENYKRYEKLSQLEMTKLCVTIVKHISIDIIRQRNHICENELALITRICEDDSLNPEKYMENQELIQEIQLNILSVLPLQMKKVLILKYYFQFSNRDISKMLDLSLKTVEMTLYRAKIKMRKNFESNDERPL